MELKHISGDKIYRVSGSDLMEIIEYAVEQTIARIKLDVKPLESSGTHKLNHKDAAKYLGVKPATLYQWNKIYNIKREGVRNIYYTLEELKRVEKERQHKHR